MACHAARRLGPMNENLAAIIGVELLTGAQGIDFRTPLKTSQSLQDVIARVRTDVAGLKEDRFMAPDLECATGLVSSGALLAASTGITFPAVGEL